MSDADIADVMTVRVQLTFNVVLHPDAMALLQGVSKKAMPDVIAGMVQRGAQTLGMPGAAVHPMGATLAPSNVVTPKQIAVKNATSPGGEQPRRSVASEAGSQTPGGFSLPADAFDFSKRH